MGDNHVRAKPPLEAFEERYIPEPMSGCFLWIGQQHSNKKEGYGVFTNNYGMPVGQRKIWLAHRAAWEFYRGPIPEFDADGNRIVVCHKCDNPACVNPDHLFLGTDMDNVHDSMSKGRHQTEANPCYARGSKKPTAKLDEVKVSGIRGLLSLDFPRRLIAEEFGVSCGLIDQIAQGRVWKHVA